MTSSGWKDAIWSLPKRLFSAVPGAVNENSAFGSGDDTSFPSEVKTATSNLLGKV